MKIWVLLIFFLSVSYGQIIYHQPIHIARAGNDLYIEAIIDDNSYGIDRANVFFKNYNQFDFLHMKI